MALLFSTICHADSRNQTFNDFTTPMPIEPGQTLIIGVVGGWERWDNPVRCIRRTAIEIKRMKLPDVYVETVENHKLQLAEELIRKVFDFNRDGTLSPDEAKGARVILFGQSLGGRAALRFARTLQQMQVDVLLAFVVDAYGKDSYKVPPNVRVAANIYQRDHIMVKGAEEIIAEDPSRTQILYNKRVTYKGREKTIDASEHSGFHRFFMGAHIYLEYDLVVWDEVRRTIISAIPSRD